MRYEDKVTNPDHPFACGIMLKLITAETTNSQWQPTTLDAEAILIHKVHASSNIRSILKSYSELNQFLGNTSIQ